jgi:CTD small phosphatase-like protein 2
MKDLTKIGKDLRKIIIIDNMKENFKLQQDNGIHIKSWFNDNPNDTELLKIGQALKDIYLDGIEDVRQGVRAFLKKPKLRQSVLTGAPAKVMSPNNR